MPPLNYPHQVRERYAGQNREAEEKGTQGNNKPHARQTTTIRPSYFSTHVCISTQRPAGTHFADVASSYLALISNNSDWAISRAEELKDKDWWYQAHTHTHTLTEESKAKD